MSENAGPSESENKKDDLMVRGSQHMTHANFAKEIVIKNEVEIMSETGPSLKSIAGLPNLLGVSETERGNNFALFSQHATSVTLCLSLSDRHRHGDET